MTHILYYITSHGYGHAVRSAAVCNALGELFTEMPSSALSAASSDKSTKASPRLRLTIKSDIPAQFFKEELTAPHDVIRGGFDVGCLQRDGVTVLVEETLRAYSDISTSNKSALDDEVRWCADNGVNCIVSDIVPFAFEVAETAMIPSVAIGNFTWHDIYLPYVKQFQRYDSMLADMAYQHSKASIALALYPSSPMTVFGDRKRSIPIIGRKGNDRKDELFDFFGIDRHKRLGLIYIGNFGLDKVNWGRLESLGGWEFVGVYPLPGNPRNFRAVTKDQFRYQDLSASADAIIGKMGYGVFSESLINGIPLVYLPRDDFSEFQALDAEARRLGSGVCINTDEFAGFGWGDLLDGFVNENKMKPAAGNGARLCAQEIVKIADIL